MSVPDELVEACWYKLGLALVENGIWREGRLLAENQKERLRDSTRSVLSAVSEAGYSICKFPVFPEEVERDDEPYVPSAPEYVSEDEPIIHGRRWKAERDEARAQAEALAEALEYAREAIRYTREYVGEENLPAVKGWSWFDATTRADDALRAFREAQGQA